MRVYIIAGEASGDLHGSNLMRAILDAQPDATIRFWGGDRMAEVMHESGSRSISQARHIRDLAYMGFVEVVAHLGTIAGNIRFCKHDIDSFHPDTIVFIDYPGFNLKIAKYTHAHGYRNVYYISPQIWAWKKNRIRPMRRDLDSLCYILPTEQGFYAANSFPQAVYVGHPLLDEIELYRNSGRQPVANGSGMPGSRKQELRRVLPGMVELAKRYDGMQFVIAGMSLIGEEFYGHYLTADIKNVSIVYDRTYDLLASSTAAVVCSGTATLETALFGVPQVVCYRCSRISAAIARRLIASRIKYISLVNLIADKAVVAELIQDDFNPDRLNYEFAKIAFPSEARDSMIEDYNHVASLLGGAGASQRTAAIVVNYKQ